MMPVVELSSTFFTENKLRAKMNFYPIYVRLKYLSYLLGNRFNYNKIMLILIHKKRFLYFYMIYLIIINSQSNS